MAETTLRRLRYGDGAMPCRECKVAFCDTSDRFCSACGAPLLDGLERVTPGLALIQIALARQDAEDHGEHLQ